MRKGHVCSLIRSKTKLLLAIDEKISLSRKRYYSTMDSHDKRDRQMIIRQTRLSNTREGQSQCSPILLSQKTVIASKPRYSSPKALETQLNSSAAVS